MTEYNLERGLPASADMERSVLGAILLDENCVKQTETLRPYHFSLDSHRRIFGVLVEMWGEGIPLDPLTVAEFLRGRNQLEAIGGVAYLASLTDGVPPRANIEHYVKIVHEKAQLRALIIQANKTIQRALEQEKPQNIIADLEKAHTEIAADTSVHDREIFLSASQFIHTYNESIQWRVDRVIEVGTNGIMVALPKGGKSFSSVGLAVCLASGAPWLDFAVRQSRTALISREDYAGTTSRRIRRFIEGMGLDEKEVGQNLFVSSRAQLQSLLLDNPSDLRLIINNLKRRKIEFCILDVLNVLHSKDENDNSEMRQVLRCVDHIRNEVGCQILVVHHSKKQWDEGMTLSESARGSTAIGGFAEFLIGIRLVDEDQQIRQMKFETKAAEPQSPIYWAIRDLPSGGCNIERCEAPIKQTTKRRAADVIAAIN